MEPTNIFQHAGTVAGAEKPGGPLVMYWSVGADGQLTCEWLPDGPETSAGSNLGGPTPIPLALAG